MLQDFYQTQKFIELNLNSLEQRIKPSQVEGFSFTPMDTIQIPSIPLISLRYPKIYKRCFRGELFGGSVDT
jgi:hypothetical protein